MTKSESPSRSWLRSIGIGIGVSFLTALIMVPMLKSGISPFPEPLGLAFAETVLGRPLPLPVGLLFHTAYVTFWSAVFVRYFPQQNFLYALLLALALWIVVLLIFFPVVGWGFAGLNVGPKLIPASLLPHLLFGVFLWGLHKYLPGGVSATREGRPHDS